MARVPRFTIGYSMSKKKIVIVGNGIAGFSAASAARRSDPRCDLTIVSAENHPLYSPCVLPEYISGNIPREKTFIKGPDDYEQRNIRTLFGRQVMEWNASEGRIFLDKGGPLSFDRLVLATGSESISFGQIKEGVFRLKTLADADNLLRHRGKKAVVVGSGAIGIEVAAALRFRGYEVILLEMLDHVLPLGLDRAGALRVKRVLEKNGILVRVGERATGVLGARRVEGLATDQQEVACDTLVWAVGMRPRVDLARAAGIALGALGGILVDAHMETSVPGVFACGDCAETRDMVTGAPALNLFWHNGNRQGAVAGCNCAGNKREYPGSQNLLNVDVFGHHVVGFGYTEAMWSQLKGSASGIRIIENEEKTGYFRLVIWEDRCIGAQFINLRRDLGLIWSIIIKRKSIASLIKTLADEALMERRPWLHRVRPYLLVSH